MKRIALALVAAALAAVLTAHSAAAACIPFRGRGIVTNVSRYGQQTRWHVTGYTYSGGVYWFSVPTPTRARPGQVVTVTGCKNAERQITGAKIR